MKKLFLMTAATMGLLASCENEVNDWTAAQNNEITFQTIVSRPGANRALIENTAYPTAVNFGAHAFLNTAGDGKPGKSTYIANQEISYQAPNWAPVGTKYYWPKTGSLTFFAYSPYTYQETGGTAITPTAPVIGDDVASSTGFQFKDYDVDAHQLTDLMVADIQVGQTANGSNGGYTGVPTIFYHKLAQVVGFVFQTDKEYENISAPTAGCQQFFVETITLKNVVTNGTYTSHGITTAGTNVPENWADATSPVTKDYVWYNDASNGQFGIGTKKLYITKNNPGTALYQSPTIDNDYLLVRPQTFSDNLKVEVKYYTLTYDGTNWTNKVYETVEVALKDVHNPGEALWDMNKRYTYTLTFTNNEILWAPSVVDWIDVDGGSHTF